MHPGTRRALCALALAAMPVLVAAQDAPASDVPEVRTSATATRGVRPDLATVTLQFAATGRTPREAGARVAMRADSLRRAIGAIGIPRDSLVSRAQWGWWPTRIEILPQPVRYPPPVPNAQWVAGVQDTLYRAHDAIEVRIRDLSKVGAVIDTAMAHRITEISPVHFSATDVSAVRDVLLGEATRR
ncbi:MAG TPA: SIMPL domain-containing protein, partial [Candidatus Elarobacter sp.]|nr:SIMPL domain-containing protein [Candidatus Elarobacter sp.]